MYFCEKCYQEVVPPRRGMNVFCPKCGDLLSELTGTPDGLQPGVLIGGFRIIREIGRGAMGQVYLAKQMNLERYVAIKTLAPSHVGDSEFVEKFFSEARSAAALSHPNIVQAYDSGKNREGVYFFVMELVDGENLDAIIQRDGAMDLEDGLRIGIAISDALNHAWTRQKLCHGDIKPENILLKRDGTPKLADLGLANDPKKRAEEERNSDGIMATPAYAPPEVIRGQRDRIGIQSDMYSFGSTLYHLFTGEAPFRGDDPAVVCDMQLNQQTKPLVSARPGTPSALSVLVDKLMEKDPGKRPATWTEITEELERILGAIEFERAEAERLAVEAQKWWRQPQMVRLIILCALIVLVVLLFLILLLSD